MLGLLFFINGKYNIRVGFRVTLVSAQLARYST